MDEQERVYFEVVKGRRPESEAELHAFIATHSIAFEAWLRARAKVGSDGPPHRGVA